MSILTPTKGVIPVDFYKALNSLDFGVSILEPIRNKEGCISDFRYIFSNAAFGKIKNVTLEHLQNTTLLREIAIPEEQFRRIVDVVDKDLPFSEEVFNNSLNKWLLISLKKYNDGYMVVTEDITLKKKTEEQLKINEKLFSTLFNNSGVGIVLMDYEGKVIKANSKICEMFGYERDEAIGLDRQEVYPSNKTENGWELYIKLINKEIKSYEIEKEYKRKDGTTFWGLLTMSLFDSDNNKNPQAIAVIQDIDLRKRAENSVQDLNRELVELNDYKDKVVSVIAHDLRGPFSTSKQLLDYILETLNGITKDDLCRCLQLLNMKFTSINGLLEELILWAKNQLNKIPFSPQILDVGEELQKVITNCTSQASEKQIRITVHQPSPTTAIADKNMFDAIVRNILTNAIKFSPANSEILIKAEQEAEKTLISVIDPGVGMTEDTIKNIEVGRNHHIAYGTEGEKGLGLGLCLTKEFIEKHNGELIIKSNTNAGTNVSFTLPAY